jgi:iron-sulfur cluster repair protein YtfE (RIC family)
VGTALDLLREATAEAAAGHPTAVELREPARPVLAKLIDEGGLDRALLMIERDGARPRVVVAPRRAKGKPTVTELLEADHARLDGILDKLKEQLAANDIGAVASAHLFAFGMRRHVTLEDRVLFPLYERRTGIMLSDNVRQIAIEHASVRHYISLLVAAADKMANPKTRAEGADDLEHIRCGLEGVLEEHDAREERLLFPTIDHTIGAEERPDLLRAVVLFDDADPSAAMAAFSQPRRGP